MRKLGMFTTVALGMFALGAVALVVQLIPDIQRYQRMRRM